MRLSFDNSLPAFVECLLKFIDKDVVQDGVILRDASGRLAFFARMPLAAETQISASEALQRALGPYLREDLPIADVNAPGSPAVLEDPTTITVPVRDLDIRVLDRRIVGADWVRGPAPPVVSGPPRLVFASLKGGVGRSTAISVAAADAARRGRNVLVIDLDLEAPGIGTLLLDDGRRPQFGTLDYLVETGLYEIEDTALSQFIGTSALTDGAGQVDVMPVVGRSTVEHPTDYMAKLSRAMIERVKATGGTIPVRERLREMVDRFSGRNSYDLILIDARAGMSELTAGPLLGLGASTVFLFTTAQQQSIEAYRLLFAHLSTLVAGPPSPWRPLQMVHAKASLDDASHSRLTDELWTLFSEYLYEEMSDTEGFNFTAADPSAPHAPIPILFDTKFGDWDPVKTPTQLSKGAYEATFGRLLERVEDA
jgi:cellulose biosynthesis protein BcsQ